MSQPGLGEHINLKLHKALLIQQNYNNKPFRDSYVKHMHTSRFSNSVNIDLFLRERKHDDTVHHNEERCDASMENRFRNNHNRVRSTPDIIQN